MSNFPAMLIDFANYCRTYSVFCCVGIINTLIFINNSGPFKFHSGSLDNITERQG